MAFLAVLEALAALAQIGKTGADLWTQHDMAKKQEEEEKNRRAIELANYMSDRFGQTGYGGGRSWW